ncbi:MAG: hypothetical protein M1820_006977 [Bogoriella megaspora]|nr:MAG: hypothetical protein M1820_006977 [Bogoriella megaspora]
MPLPLNLLSLPTEIISNIADHLPTLDLINFRSTCSYFQELSLRTFGTRCFSSRQFMIFQVSLDALQGISESDRLRPYVQKLGIGIDSYEPLHRGNVYVHEVGLESQLSTKSRDIQARYDEAYYELVDEQRYLRSFGTATHIIAKALSRFHNCKHISIVADGRGSWGRNILKHTTNRLPSCKSSIGFSKFETWASTVGILLAAIASSGIELHTLSSNINLEECTEGIPFSCFDVPKRQLLQLALRTYRLRELSLMLTDYSDMDPDHEFDSVHHDLLVPFMVSMGDLERLSLGFLHTSNADLKIYAISKLSFPFLKYLKLEWIVIDWNPLLEFIEQQTALEHLDLTEIYLRDSKRSEIFEGLLRKDPPLQSLRIGYLKEYAIPKWYYMRDMCTLIPGTSAKRRSNTSIALDGTKEIRRVLEDYVKNMDSYRDDEESEEEDEEEEGDGGEEGEEGEEVQGHEDDSDDAGRFDEELGVIYGDMDYNRDYGPDTDSSEDGSTEDDL